MGIIGTRLRFEFQETATVCAGQIHSNIIPAGSEALLVLDLGAQIYCCDEATAAHFGGAVTDLFNQPLASLIPGLPFRRATPGYNLAYATLWSHSGHWRTLDALKLDGRSFLLAIAPAVLSVNREHRIILGLRKLAADDGACAFTREHSSAAMRESCIAARHPGICGSGVTQIQA